MLAKVKAAEKRKAAVESARRSAWLATLLDSESTAVFDPDNLTRLIPTDPHAWPDGWSESRFYIAD